MSRIAIVGGGIAGLAAAFELELQRRAGKPVDWHLFEASDRFGGIVSTTRLETAEGAFVLEDGPDGWVAEKPWAEQLARELGLGEQILPCNEAEKCTYLWLDGRLVAMPPRMRLMVPEDLSALEGSTLFSDSAKIAFADELARAEELKASSPRDDESVAAFVRRHFGQEVLGKVAGPLLAGIFGGDVERLSVRAVMPTFVELEAAFGSLVLGLQSKARQRVGSEPRPTFLSLRDGMGSLIEALLQFLPGDRLHTGSGASALLRTGQNWLLRFSGPSVNGCAVGFVPFDAVLLATPTDVTRRLLQPVDEQAAALIPTEASSAVLVTFCWPGDLAGGSRIPNGFGFLVPPSSAEGEHQLLAATFSNQKYAHRAPEGARILRAFFGGESAAQVNSLPDAMVAGAALAQLRGILGPLPNPAGALTTVRRWPRSLPQYEVGHGERMSVLARRIQELGNFALLGNGYRGVGVPDLIREARAAARTLTETTC
jgi:protoporphyrinogen/coproporphyrinogen III oxidase